MNAAIMQRLRAAYYTFDFLRHSRYSQSLGRAVHAWEINRWGDSPKDAARWTRQFASGEWDHLRRDPDEFSRYSTIVGYMSQHAGGDFLDVGCGAGELFRRFAAYPHRRYVGIDISAVATSKCPPAATFIAADADIYEPEGHFDVIVFNDTLYYLKDPLASLHRYARHLKDDGIMIVSNYTDSAAHAPSCARLA